MDRTDLLQRRELLTRRWDAAVIDGAPPAPRGPQDVTVLDSWSRSAANVDPALDAAPCDGGDDALMRWRGSRMEIGIQAAADDVRRVVDDGDLVAAVTDRDGRIVWTYGGRVMQRAADRVNFVPGGRWDEASVGTNALALALRTGRASSVYSAEHWSRAVHGWVCYAVPLLDPHTGTTLGVFDLSTTWDRAHPLVLGTAQALGHLMCAAMPAPSGLAGVLEVTVLGGWGARLGGIDLRLPRRQLEIVTLLALHPAGLSAAELHAHLYGDTPVSAATLKAEVSHLRTALGGRVGSRPYRLDLAVDGDLQALLVALERGDLPAAVAAYGGELLPGSESMGVCEWRDYVEVALRSAVLGSKDVASVMSFAGTQPYDVAVHEHLLALLPAGDPRRPLAQASLARAQA